MSSAAEGNGLRYQVKDHERRIDKLESYEPAVLQQTCEDLKDDVKSLKRAFYTFAFGVVGSAIVFAFTVFAWLGHS